MWRGGAGAGGEVWVAYMLIFYFASILVDCFFAICFFMV